MACSKYTITNSSSILTNFNYRRCDDSLWEYQAELGPNETKNIWLMNDTYSTSFVNDIVIDSSTEYPITPTTEPYNQTALVYALNQNNNSWVYSILNFTNQSVIGNIDLGVPGSYSVYGTAGLNQSGYGILFENQSDNEWSFVCMNSVGNVIDRYNTTNIDGIEFGTVYGAWVTFDDEENGVFKYFNGSYVGTINYDYPNQGLGVIGSISTGSLIIELFNITETGTTQTIKLLSPGGVENTIRVNGTQDSELTTLTYSDGDFILILDKDDGVNWTSLEIYDSSGTTLLQNISLTGASYIGNADVLFYGNNKVTVILFDDSGPGEHYIINYNGNTDTITTTTVDAVIYPSYFSYYNDNYFPNVSPSENMYMLFFGQLDTVNSLEYVNNAVILSFINESPTVDSYVFQNSGTFNKAFSSNIGVSNTLFLAVNNGDGILSMLSINESGHTITSTGLPLSGISGEISVIASFGDNCYMSVSSTGTCSDNAFVYGYNGLLRDSLSGGTFDDYKVSYDTLWLRSLGSGCVSSYYMNNQNSGFTETDIFFGGAYSQSACYIPNFTYNGALLIYDDSTLNTKIITPSSVSETFQIKSSTYIRGGTNYFIDLDEISGSTLYDFSGNIINTNNQQFNSSCLTQCFGAISSRYFYSNIVNSNSIFNLSGVDNNRNISMYTNSGDSYTIILNDTIYDAGG